MDSIQRRVAAWYALLASVSSLTQLRPGVRLDMEDRFREFLTGEFPTVGYTRGKRGTRHILTLMHHTAHEDILGLLDHGSAPAKMYRHGSRRLVQGQMEETVDIPMVRTHDPFASLLARIFWEQPFPFRRCPHCEVIFVPSHGRQRNCSPNCMVQGVERARREKKEG
jgi:hypothetical protein